MVVATGRNPQSLKDLAQLGADETIALTDDISFTAELKEIHGKTPITVVVDYLWAHPAEMILSCLKGDGSFGKPLRYVSVGSVAGDQVALSAAILRSIDIQLTGSGLGAWTREQVNKLFSDILPEAFALAAGGKLRVSTVTIPFPDIAEAWRMEIHGGQRLVAII